MKIVYNVKGRPNNPIVMNAHGPALAKVRSPLFSFALVTLLRDLTDDFLIERRLSGLHLPKAHERHYGPMIHHV